MRTRLLIVMATMIALMLAIGCSKNPTETNNTTASTQDDNINLNDQYGGYTATNEQEAFGDADLAQATEGEAEYDDAMATNSVVEDMCNDPKAGWYHFRAVWGNLTYDSTATTPTDWTGSLTITRGALLVRRVIRFEPATDWLLPRTDRKLVEWVSQTTVHNDGLAFDIVVPRPKPILDSSYVSTTDSLGNPYDSLVVDTTFDDTPVKLTFKTGPYSRTFTLDEVAKLDTIIDLEDGNSVSFSGFQLEKIGCPKGFMAGFWGKDTSETADTSLGVFRGLWVGQHGLIEGYVKGHYGIDSTGAQVFFGKWISVDGQFEGFLKGSYRILPTMRPYPGVIGQYRGEIFDANSAPIGWVKGLFRSGPEMAGGFFSGRWKFNCGSDNNDDNGELAGAQDDGF